MSDETDPVLSVDVGDWQLGPGPGAPTIRIVVESSGGRRTVVGEAPIEAGEYELVRRDPE